MAHGSTHTHTSMHNTCTHTHNWIPLLKSNVIPYVLPMRRGPLLPSSALTPILTPLVNLGKKVMHDTHNSTIQFTIFPADICKAQPTHRDLACQTWRNLREEGKLGDLDQDTSHLRVLKERARKDRQNHLRLQGLHVHACHLPSIWKSFGSTCTPLCSTLLRPGGRTWKSVIPNTKTNK